MLRRKKPLRSKTPIAWSKPIPRRSAKKGSSSCAAKLRKRLPQRNNARAAHLRLVQFGTPERIRLINAMPCVCGGKHPACRGGFSEPSHVISRGAGGKAEDIVPMSTGCHRAWHRGRLTYLEQLGWTIDEMKQRAAEVDAQAKEQLAA